MTYVAPYVYACMSVCVYACMRARVRVCVSTGVHTLMHGCGNERVPVRRHTHCVYNVSSCMCITYYMHILAEYPALGEP